ncbi:hypothetical protein [Limnoglobus roseus]|uniref:hypothetical protein n=1 Tax=Limnoglobus roseus TaxID=2598579 RepID=UPI0011EAAC6D|nr:hypothetical protein [Limnoglobus roseus]
MGKRLEALEKPKAEERKGKRTNLEPAGKFPAGSSDGEVRDKVGAALGVSGKTYEKAKLVVEQGVQSLVKAVDAGDVSVSAAAAAAKLPPAQQERTPLATGMNKHLFRLCG